MAASKYHLQDDAFISFRYAQHIQEGLGSVWNPDDAPSFGYTNLLWTLLMAIPLPLGMETWSIVLSISALAANLCVSYLVFSLLIADRPIRLLAFVALATNHTLLAFGSSGLETALNGLLWTSLILLTLRTAGQRDGSGYLWIAFTATFCLLSRPDGIILLGTAATWSFLQGERDFGHFLRKATLYLLIPATVFAATAWGVTGDFLPISFYAKATGSRHWSDGFLYISMFLAFSSLWVVLVIQGLRWISGTKWSNREYLLATVAVAWISYLVYVGGDFMEFRMMVPILPVLVGLCFMGAAGTFRPVVNASILGVILVTSNVLQGPLLGRSVYTGWLLPTRRPVFETSEPQLSFRDQGLELKRLFEKEDSLVLAIGNAGIVPFVSDLRFVDVLGLTDLDVARNGLQVNFAPGHRRLASWTQLKEKGVHWLVLRCDRSDHSPSPESVFQSDPFIRAMRQAEPELNSPVVQIALTNGFVISGLYLRPHPAIETLRLEKTAVPS
jgi:arabinofuranosyltransferase